MTQRLMMVCTECGGRGPGMKEHCGKPTEPYTGGAATKGHDSFWRWQFFINGNQRGAGTDPHPNAQAAIKDFNEVMEYTIP